MPTLPAPHPTQEPSRWLQGTPLLDLEDPKLVVRTRALTQLLASDREKAVAIHGFVQRIPFGLVYKVRIRTPREVLLARKADVLDKTGLFVAMLRCAGIPARVRLLRLDGRIVAGFTKIWRSGWTGRSVVQAWLDGRWVQTDTHVFDHALVEGARLRLAMLGWDYGYGICAQGDASWDGRCDTFLVGRRYAQSHLAPEDEDGVFADPQGFRDCKFLLKARSSLTREYHFNQTVAASSKVIRELRELGEICADSMLHDT